MKSCSNKKCVQINPQNINCFYKIKTTKDGLSHHCKFCKREYYKKHRNLNLQRYNNYRQKWLQNNSEKRKESWFRCRYGIELIEKEQMLKDQNYKCKICDKPENKNFKLHVDHSHKSGKVRSMLCLNCNVALGNVKEDLNIAKNLINYIMEYCNEN